MKGKSLFITAIIVLFVCLFAFLIYPFLMMLISSFQTNTQDAFTLNNYQEVFTKPMYLTAFMNSIVISFISSILALAVTMIATYAIKEKSKKIQDNILVMANLTSNFAGIPLAFAFIILLGNTGLFILLDKSLGLNILDGFNLYSWSGLILIYIYFQLPLGIMLLNPIFDGLDKNWREAATILGASDFQYWKRIAIPYITPSVLGVFTIMFANAMGAYASAYALTGSTYNMLAIRIGATVSGDIFARPEIAASLSIILSIILFVNLVVNDWLTSRMRRDIS
nr:ABC transporter permease subunit [Mammaliicoccus sp. Marseille-Q6498]